MTISGSDGMSLQGDSGGGGGSCGGTHVLINADGGSSVL